ncbi:MAG: hypothetical protein ACLSW1_04040 [Lachnospira sp.]
MKKIIKTILGICMSLIVVFCTSFVVKAEYTTTGYSTNRCYSICGQYMGAACLTCDFSWSEGNYVTALSVNTYFSKNHNHNYTCYFEDIRKTESTSNSFASGWCNYLTSDNVCYEVGYLEVVCDVYGDTVDNGYYEFRECQH